MKPILDSQICQIESDFKQYFSKIDTFNPAKNLKKSLLIFQNYLNNY